VVKLELYPACILQGRVKKVADTDWQEFEILGFFGTGDKKIKDCKIL